MFLGKDVCSLIALITMSNELRITSWLPIALYYIVGSSKSRNSKAKESTSLPSADESDSQSSLKVGGPSSAKRIRYDGEDSLDG